MWLPLIMVRAKHSVFIDSLCYELTLFEVIGEWLKFLDESKKNFEQVFFKMFSM